MTPAGKLTEFQIGTPDSRPAMLALGSDGNVWFTEPQVDKVGKITPQGAISELQFPVAGVPLGIASGADKSLWVTMVKAHLIYQITTDGQFKEFRTPDATMATFIAAGPDGNLWFTEPNGKIGRLTPSSGTVEEFLYSQPYAKPADETR
jgi:virginiamycin B lyase